MSKRKRNSHKLLHERLTLLLVLLFCVFISSSEFFVEDTCLQEMAETGVSADDQDKPSEDKAFIHEAMDAVVPFVAHTVDQAFHFIYEIIGYKALNYSSDFHVTLSHNQLFEVLFEQIISVNAP